MFQNNVYLQFVKMEENMSAETEEGYVFKQGSVSNSFPRVYLDVLHIYIYPVTGVTAW